VHLASWRWQAAPTQGDRELLEAAEVGRLVDSPQRSPLRDSAGPPVAPERVLIIDDDDIVAEAMREIIAREGHHVLAVPSAIGATQVIMREGVRVVVIDIHMPSISGDKLAQLLRKNPRVKHIGIILVSGIEQRQLEGLAGEVSADAVVSKHKMRSDLATAVGVAARRAQLRDPLKS
jgi:CheY-like chemotaxis protein